eukprot:m.31485 g.31485  ORF g.31485 m.31485 type:complete len:71 (+) comp9318_c0_seq1:1585-1797(+)
MSDSHLSAMHRNVRLLDIVDDEWRKDTLASDAIAIPAQHEVPIDEIEESAGDNPKEMENKWTELGMQDFQ